MSDFRSAFSIPADTAHLDVVAKARAHGRLTERLSAANAALEGIDADSLPIEHVDWLATELGRAVQSDFLEDSAAAVMREYPAVAAAAVASATSRISTAEEFPTALATSLAVDEDLAGELAQALGEEGYAVKPAAREAREIDPLTPWLELDPVSGKLFLTLPCTETLWLVDAGFDTFRIKTGAGQLQPTHRPTRVAIVQPTDRITVTNTASGRKYRLPVVDAAFPVMAFDPDLRPLTDTARITTDSVFILAPTRTKFFNGSPAAEVPLPATDELRFTAWEEWSLFEFRDLGATGVETLSLHIANPEQLTTFQVCADNSAASRFPVWEDLTGRIDDVTGADSRPVFRQSPRLRLPAHEPAEWVVELYYLSPEGERELVEELLDVDSHAGESFGIFADAYEDAWVGHYEVDVLRDGVLFDRRSYNLAEGFDLRVTYNGSSFRHPDRKADANAYTKAYFTQRSESPKFIDVPFSKTQSVGREEQTKHFRIHNAVEYALDVVVTPKALRYSLDLRGQQPEWDQHPGALVQGSLSKNGELKVHFPVPAGGTAALLLTHEVSRKVKALQLKRRRHGEVFTINNSAITHAFPEAHADVVASVAWHPAGLEETYEVHGAEYYSRLEFEKAYEAHATPDIQLATLLRFTESGAQAQARVDGDVIALGGKPGDTALGGFLWPLTLPDVEPWPVFFSPQGQARVPAELVGAGPLLLEVVETKPGYLPKAPNRPSRSAVVLEQPGAYNGADAPTGLGAKLSPDSPKAAVPKEEQAHLWRQLYALRHVEPALVKHLNPIIRKTIDTDPRHMLEALGRCNVRVGNQPALFIAHGLVNYDFHVNGSREVDFRAVPWVRVIEQLNDLVDGRLDSAAERDDAVEFIARAGGSALLELLQGGEDTATGATQEMMKDVVTAAKDNALARAIEALHDTDSSAGVASIEGMRHGWAQLLRRRKKFEDIEGFAAFREEMFKQEANIVGQQLRAHLHLLRRFGMTYGKRQRNQWAWVPYLSAVASHVARAGAAELKGAQSYYIPIKAEHLSTWASIAQLAPALTIFDVVREEARQLTRAAGPLEASALGAD